VLEGINGSNGAITHSLALVGTMPADGFFVVADDAGGGATLVSGADFVLNFDFQNAGNVRSRPCKSGYLRPVVRSVGSYTFNRPASIAAEAAHLRSFRVDPRTAGSGDRA
jgi:hypothetical protein